MPGLDPAMGTAENRHGNVVPRRADLGPQLECSSQIAAF